MYMNFRVKEICKSKGIFMEDLATTLGIAPTSLSRSLNNNPTIETLEKIANALDVSVVELFEPESDFYGVVIYKGNASD